MHQHIINASIQIVPIVQDRHPYEWVDDAIEIIKSSGIKYEVGPFATVVEGTYDDVMSVINNVNDYLLEKNCTEWITNVQIQIRSNGDITSGGKDHKISMRRFCQFLKINIEHIIISIIGPAVMPPFSFESFKPIFFHCLLLISFDFVKQLNPGF